MAQSSSTKRFRFTSVLPARTRDPWCASLFKNSWDTTLRKWIPTKSRVVYKFGTTPDQVEIWLEDFDALGWFGCGRYDLDIFLVCTTAQSLLRWKQINENYRVKSDLEDVIGDEHQAIASSTRTFAWALWSKVLFVSLFVHYVFHLFFMRTS
jgi:hypothetical protein